MGKIIYPDLSYQIFGILYKVHNRLAWGYQERYYRLILRGFENPKSSSEFAQSGIDSGINIREFGNGDISNKLGHKESKS